VEIGSSGWIRTHNPPVNSCTASKTANYRQVLSILKIRLLGCSRERMSTTNFRGDSLKKSPKYFPASAWKVGSRGRAQPSRWCCDRTPSN
jgi:hypothetical protein